MLGYTWVVFEKFSVLFSRDGYLFSTKFLYFFHEMGTFFKKLSGFFVQGGYFFVWIFLCVFQKVGAIYAEFFCIFQQGGYLLKGFLLYFGFKVGGFPVSHTSISSLSVNTSLIVGNLLWKVFNHYHLSSALVLFTNWLIKAAGLSVHLVDLWFKDVYTIYAAMLKSIHTTCQICAFAHWSLCNLFVWWSHDHFMRQLMKHNSSARRQKGLSVYLKQYPVRPFCLRTDELHSFPSQSCRKKEVWRKFLFWKHKALIKMSFQEWIEATFGVHQNISS